MSFCFDSAKTKSVCLREVIGGNRKFQKVSKIKLMINIRFKTTSIEVFWRFYHPTSSIPPPSAILKTSSLSDVPQFSPKWPSRGEGTDRHPRLISAFGSERGSKFRFFEKIPNKNDLPLVCVVCLTAVRSRAISKPSSVRVRFTFHDISSATLNLNSPKRIRNGSRGKLTVKHTAQTIE